MRTCIFGIGVSNPGALRAPLLSMVEWSGCEAFRVSCPPMHMLKNCHRKQIVDTWTNWPLLMGLILCMISCLANQVTKHHQSMPVICCHTWLFKQILLLPNSLRQEKGLEAYNQFICGWVKELSTCKVAS